LLVGLLMDAPNAKPSFARLPEDPTANAPSATADDAHVTALSAAAMTSRLRTLQPIKRDIPNTRAFPILLDVGTTSTPPTLKYSAARRQERAQSIAGCGRAIETCFGSTPAGRADLSPHDRLRPRDERWRRGVDRGDDLFRVGARGRAD